MSKIINILRCVVMLALSSITLADTIIIAADLWCPYNCEPNSSEPGFVVEVAKNVFEKHGHQIIYQKMPWSRAIQDAKDGKINGIIGANKQEAPNFIFPSNEQGISDLLFYVKAGSSWKYNDEQSLKEVKLGLIQDYGYGELIDRYVKTQTGTPWVQTISGNDTLERNIQRLLLGRIEVTIENNAVMEYHLKKTRRSHFLSVAGKARSETGNIYIAFSPNLNVSTTYAKILSDGMNEISQSDRLDSIMNRYGLTNWRKD